MPDGGLLGLPFPLYEVVDRALAAVIGSIGAILVWSLLCSAAVLFLYRLCSPQQKLRDIKARMREIGVELNKNPDDLALLLRLSGENIKIAFSRFLLTFLPTCVAIIPLLSLATWLNSNYGYLTPNPSESVVVTALPEGADIAIGATLESSSATNTIDVVQGMTGFVVTDRDTQLLTEISFPPRGNHMSRRSGWSLLLGNPMGYLPEDGSVETILFDFSRREFLKFGPEWLRGWEALFLLGMTVFSIALKVAFKVE